MSGTTSVLLSAVRDYQEVGASWMVKTLQDRDTRAVLLCDDPGLGKSLQVLIVMHRLGVRRACVVSPAGARRVWHGQIARWFPKWLKHVVIVEPGSLPSTRELDAPDVIALVSYDQLSLRGSPWRDTLQRLAWDLLVIDEAHYLKNKSNRTAALYGLKGTDEGIQTSAERVILLTGTPSPNHAGEMYQHLRTFWPGVLRSLEHPDRPMTEEEFVERVCEWRDDPRLGRVVTGSKNVAWLRERMRPYYMHRSKRQVLRELPPVVEQDVPLAVSPRDVLAHLNDDDRRLHGGLMKLDEDALSWMMHQPGTPLATLRRRLGELKVNGTAEWIMERLDCGARKLLVFGWHPRALELLHTRLMEFRPVLVTGATSAQARARAVECFQERPDCRVFVGQIKAAGVALTLTAASEVAIMEPSWVPGENRQAIDRAHRMGQRDSVLATYLYLPGTLDRRILDTMRRKQGQIRELLQESA